MGLAKHQHFEELEKQAYAQKRKVEGYTKSLLNTGKLAGNCWACDGGLSIADREEPECVHCGFSHPWHRSENN